MRFFLAFRSALLSPNGSTRKVGLALSLCAACLVYVLASVVPGVANQPYRVSGNIGVPSGSAVRNIDVIVAEAPIPDLAGANRTGDQSLDVLARQHRLLVHALCSPDSSGRFHAEFVRGGKTFHRCPFGMWTWYGPPEPPIPTSFIIGVRGGGHDEWQFMPVLLKPAHIGRPRGHIVDIDLGVVPISRVRGRGYGQR